MELAPDLSNEVAQEQVFLIVVLYNKSRIIELQAKALNTQALREKYMPMLANMILQKGITIQVYRQVDDGWQIIEEHLF